MSRYQIAKQAGIAESTLSRFVTGKGSLNLDTLDALADVLGVRLVCGRAKRKAR